MVMPRVPMLFIKTDPARHTHEFPDGCAVGTRVFCPWCRKKYTACAGTTTRIKWKPEFNEPPKF